MFYLLSICIVNDAQEIQYPVSKTSIKIINSLIAQIHSSCNQLYCPCFIYDLRGTFPGGLFFKLKLSP